MSRIGEAGSVRFTDDDPRQVLEVVDRLQDVEVHLEIGDLKLHLRKFSGNTAGTTASPMPVIQVPEPGLVAAAPVPALAAPTQDRPQLTAGKASGAPSPTAVAIRAPMLGRFFCAPSPTQPAYVQVGQRVGEGDPVCLIEVMKLFNTVSSTMAGTVVRVDGVNGEMVEYDQPLFWVEPA